MEDKLDSLLDMIPQTSKFYYYFRGCWANGKEGTITDSSGHGIYRFYPFIKDENGNRIDSIINHEDYITNPIVAEGIIAYWLHYRPNNDCLASYTTWAKEEERKNTLKIFSDYTEDKLNQYIKREQYSPSSWRRDLKREFYMDFIIRNEEALNEKTQALMEYITPSDQQQVKEVIAEYMLFLEEKRKEYKDNSSVRKSSPNAGNKRKPKVAKNKDAFTKATFTCKGLEGDQFMEQRRGVLCDLLFECFVASKKEKEDIEREKIEKLFSGKPLKEKDKITWKGTKKELVYFFRQLKDYLNYSSKENFWNVVASHFVIETQGKKIVQGQRKIRNVPISADSLQSTTEKPKKDIMKKLDGIISVLTAPIAEVLQLHTNSNEGDAAETRNKDLADQDLLKELLGYKDKK